MRQRISVVEDHEDIRRILRDLLGAGGYAMIEAQALAKVAASTPDLVLMDIQPPGIDGYEATWRIKADPVVSCRA